MKKPHIIFPDRNFAGHTTARYIHAAEKDKAVNIIIDRKFLLAFVPSISMQVLANFNAALHLEFTRLLRRTIV